MHDLKDRAPLDKLKCTVLSMDLAHYCNVAGMGGGEPGPGDDGLVLPDQPFLLRSSAILLAMWRLGS